MVTAFQAPPSLVHRHVTTCTQLAASRGNDPRRPLTPAQRAIQKTIREKENKTGFDKFKNSFYQGIDKVQSIVSGTESGDATIIIDGYSEEQALKTKSKKTYPLNILQTKTLMASTSKIKDPSRSPSRSVFESVKGAVYNTLDAASPKRKKTPSTTAPIDDDLPPVAANPASSQAAYSKRMLELFPDLESNNLFKKSYAEFQANLLERKEEARKEQLRRQEQFQQFKANAYEALDNLQAAGRNIATVPGKVQKGFVTTVDVVQTIPGQLQRTFEQIVEIPDKVEKKANEIQESVTQSIETGQRVVDDVKALPDRTKQKVKETQEGFNAAIDSVNEFATNTKVFLGLEKPKPKPPKIPPPAPSDPTEKLLQVAGSVAFGAGKFVFWAGQQLAGVAFEGVKVAASKGAESLKEQAVERKRGNVSVAVKESVTAKQYKASSPWKPKTATTMEAETSEQVEAETKKVETKEAESVPSPKKESVLSTEELERQVEEALSLASDVLNEAKKLSSDNKNKKV